MGYGAKSKKLGFLGGVRQTQVSISKVDIDSDLEESKAGLNSKTDDYMSRKQHKSASKNAIKSFNKVHHF